MNGNYKNTVSELEKFKFTHKNLEICEDLLGKCKNEIKPVLEQSMDIKKLVHKIDQDTRLETISNSYKPVLDQIEK